MSTITSNALIADLRQSNLAKLYYLYGADAAERERVRKFLLQKASGGDDNALTKFDGAKLDLDALSDAVRQFSLFCEHNCVWVHDLNADSLRDNQLKLLIALCKNVADATVLIFDVSSFDPKNGKKTVQGKNKKLVDVIAKNGVVCEAAQKTLSEMVRDISHRAEKADVVFPPDSARSLAERCAGDTLKLQNECDKLFFCVGRGGMVTSSLVAEMVLPTPETTAYALANAVVTQKARAAIRELDKLYAMRTPRPVMFYALSGAFLDLYRASAAIRAGKTVADMQHDFSYRFDFVVKNAFRDARNVRPERLRACVRLLGDLEYTLNRFGGDERARLEAAILKMTVILGGSYDAHLADDCRRGQV